MKLQRSDGAPGPSDDGESGGSGATVDLFAGSSSDIGFDPPTVRESVGLGLGVAQGVVPFGTLTDVVREPGTAEEERNIAVGQVVGSLAMILAGGGEVGLGLLGLATGVAAPAGVAGVWVGIATIGGGVTNLGMGIMKMSAASGGGSQLEEREGVSAYLQQTWTRRQGHTQLD